MYFFYLLLLVDCWFGWHTAMLMEAQRADEHISFSSRHIYEGSMHAVNMQIFLLC